MVSLISLLLILLEIISLKLKVIQNFFNPGVIFSLYWLIQLFVINIFLEYSEKNGSYFILLLAIISFFSGIIAEKIFMFNGNGITNKHTNFTYKLLITTSRNILILSIILGCFFEILQLRSNGFSFTSLFNISSLLDINQANAMKRYYGNGGGSSIFLLFVYISPLIGGFHINFSTKKMDKILSVCSLLPSFLSMLAENTKSGFIASIFFFISSFIVSCLITNKSFVIRFKYIITCIFLFVLSIYMFIFSMMLRTGELNSRMFEIAKNKIMIYALGHIPAFCYWFANSNYIVNGKGVYTFIGIYNFLGVVDREQGVYQDAVMVKGLSTNIYTVFRGLITDFNLVGTCLFIFLLIFISTISFVYIRNGKLVIFNSFILINTYFFIFHSFLSSSWTYTSFIMVMFLFVIYILLCLKKERNKSEKNI